MDVHVFEAEAAADVNIFFFNEAPAEISFNLKGKLWFFLLLDLDAFLHFRDLQEVDDFVFPDVEFGEPLLLVRKPIQHVERLFHVLFSNDSEDKIKMSSLQNEEHKCKGREWVPSDSPKRTDNDLEKVSSVGGNNFFVPFVFNFLYE